MPVLNKLTTASAAERVARAMAERDSVVFGKRRDATAEAAAGGERTCGAPGCTGRWTMPWKNRRRPIFEQEWGCSAACMTRLVETAVRREIGDGAREDGVQPHRHRVPLGLVLLAQGWITHPQLQAALDAQRASGRGRIGDWLVRGSGFGPAVQEEQIARGLGVQWSCPVLSLDSFSAAAMALVMPKRFVAEFGLVPVRVAGSRLLYLAFEERQDAAVALGVQGMSGIKVETGLLPGTAFQEARARLLEAEAVPATVKLVRDRDALTAAVVQELGKRQPVAAKIVRIHQYYWLRVWLESGAMQGSGTVPASAADVRDSIFMIGNKP